MWNTLPAICIQCYTFGLNSIGVSSRIRGYAKEIKVPVFEGGRGFNYQIGNKNCGYLFVSTVYQVM